MPNPNKSMTDRAIKRRKRDSEHMERSRQRGADKMKAKGTGAGRDRSDRNRGAEFVGSKDRHGKPLHQWCFLCNEAHEYHLP